MPSNQAKLFKNLVQAALDFYKRRLWLDVRNDDIFEFRFPGIDRPHYASVMGQAGEEYGLAIFRGTKALTHFRSLLEGEIDDDLLEDLDQIGVTIQPLREIEPDLRGPLKLAGFTGRRETLAPLFLVKEPNRLPRAVRPAEAKMLLYVLKGVLESDVQGLFEPTSGWIDGGPILCLDLAGSPNSPRIAVDRSAVSQTESPPEPTPFHFPQELEDLPRLDTKWIVGVPALSAEIAGDERSLKSILIVDSTTELVLHVEVIQELDLEQAGEVLVTVFEGAGHVEVTGLPREILFTSRSLYKALSPSLQDLGVVARFEPDDPLLDSIHAQLDAALSSGEPPGP